MSHSALVALHGLTGCLIFLTGVLQFLLRKGTRLHRLVGYTYFFSWFVIIATGAALGSVVVLSIVVLGFYLSIMGIRNAVLKNQPYAQLDRSVVAGAALIVLFLLLLAVVLFLKGNYTLAVLSSIFFLLYFLVVGRDVAFVFFHVRILSKDRGNLAWYFGHAVRMQFSFVTALSAFVAVQNVFGNILLNFTLPACMAFFLIRWHTRHLEQKFGIAPNKK